MAFSGTVRVLINGTWTTLTYNSTSRAYEAQITAPGKTSFNEPNGVYVVTAEATNTAGTVSKATTNLHVYETVKPVINISSPSSGAYVKNNKQPIVFTITDEVNGSGVDISSLVVKLNGTQITSGIVTTAITNGYSVTVTPPAMDDGSNTVTVDCSDNDGNAVDTKSTTFTVDTAPPILNVTSPVEGLITNNRTIVFSGSTNDSTSSPVTLTVGGVSVTVNSDGTFSYSKKYSADGTYTVDIVATDSAGQTTTVSRTFTIDTSAPNIRSITISPDPVATGKVMTVKVVVE